MAPTSLPPFSSPPPLLSKWRHSIKIGFGDPAVSIGRWLEQQQQNSCKPACATTAVALYLADDDVEHGGPTGEERSATSEEQAAQPPRRGTRAMPNGGAQQQLDAHEAAISSGSPEGPSGQLVKRSAGRTAGGGGRGGELPPSQNGSGDPQCQTSSELPDVAEKCGYEAVCGPLQRRKPWPQPWGGGAGRRRRRSRSRGGQLG